AYTFSTWGDLTGGQTRCAQRQDDLVDPGQPALSVRDDLRLEGGLGVAGHLDGDRPDLGEHGLSPAAGCGTCCRRGPWPDASDSPGCSSIGAPRAAASSVAVSWLSSPLGPTASPRPPWPTPRGDSPVLTDRSQSSWSRDPPCW